MTIKKTFARISPFKRRLSVTGCLTTERGWNFLNVGRNLRYFCLLKLRGKEKLTETFNYSDTGSQKKRDKISLKIAKSKPSKVHIDSFWRCHLASSWCPTLKARCGTWDSRSASVRRTGRKFAPGRSTLAQQVQKSSSSTDTLPDTYFTTQLEICLS